MAVSLADQAIQSQDTNICPEVNFYLKIDQRTGDLIIEPIFKFCETKEPQLEKKIEKPKIILPDNAYRG